MVEGDISPTADAERVAAVGVPVVQINTDRFGGECHLEAHVIRGAADPLGLDRPAFLFVENVGNLVCPGEGIDAVASWMRDRRRSTLAAGI